MIAAKFLDAVNEGNAEVVKGLLSTESDLRNSTGERNALHRAAGYGHTNVVIELINAGFNALTASHTGRIPLHEACQGGHIDVARELIKFGGIEILDSRGQSALHVAAYHGESECVKLLAAHSAHVAARDETHRTPAHLAAMMNQSDTLHWLLEFGADIDLPDVYGRTCSHYAATVANTKSLKILFERGVDLQIRCLAGRLPLHYSVTADRLCNLHLLLTHHMKGHDQTEMLNQGKLNLLLNTDNSGKCLTHIAAQNGSMNCLHWILEQGIDPNTTDNSDNTALHCAASKSQTLAYSCLLYHGAEQSAVNDKGETPMEVARKVGKPFAIKKAGQTKCPRCHQKGLDHEWELKNAPADIIIAIESTKDLLFDVPISQKYSKNMKSSGSVHSLASSGSATSTSSLPKRNIATKYYGNFVTDDTAYE